MWPASYALAVVTLVLSFSSVVVNASSKPAGRLKRFVHPSTLSVDILPRRHDQSFDNFVKRDPHPHPSTLRYSDSFRLVLTAFDDTFHIHLRPNDHLIHPSARITHYAIDPLTGESVVSHTEPLLRESVKAFEGEVVHEALSEDRMLEDIAGGLYAPFRQDRGWARIMVHSVGDIDAGIPPVFEGAFTVDGVVHHVVTKDNYIRTKHPLDPENATGFEELDSQLVIWRDIDMMPHQEESPSSQPKHCGHDDLPYNTDSELNPALKKVVPEAYNLGLLGNVSFARTDDDWSLSRRDDVAGGGMGTNFAGSIGSSNGCPTTQRLLYMGVAADCVYVSQFGNSQNATERILTDWNSATALYKSTFNVSLGIIELQIQNPQCPTTTNSSMAWNVDCSSVELDNRLSLFSQWRGAKGNDSVGLWHLMSGCPTGTEVGIAWLGTLCKQDTSGSGNSISSGTGVSTSGMTEWQVVSHEIGHNFGAIHDCTDGCSNGDSCCPLTTSSCNAQKQFIMSPVADPGERNFSPCSLGNICNSGTLLGGQNGQVDSSCLVDASNPSHKLISLQMCGNGVVDDGEDCDPGLNTSNCCTSDCKFSSGAVCDPDSSPCCTGQCSFAPATQTCRPSKDSKCDTAEMCTGNSSACPADVFSPNGQSCGGDGLACASGQCTSVALQCQNVGSSLGLSKACPNHGDTSCRISCQDPTQSNACVQLNSLLIDGSPCGYAGTCINGSCKSGSALDVAKAWYRDNLQIAIPVTVVVGIIVLLILWGCIRSLLRCCSGRRAPPSAYVGTPNYANVRHQRLASSETSAPPLLPVPTYIGGASNNRMSRGSRLSRQGASSPPTVPWNSRPQRTNWVDESTYNGPRS
ncbi:zinc metalloprotease [Dendrothele bispora CBS 962.96]|uniref:Disintegrin and metalloproteinase domain-containing protein B n=1 Tax=Dendrothele bispora (strain CBS 962.96) TaxID=1314807 RepID=A0A4S8LFH1_DENBC|nr:zinc metalloprotease [Dendrothele bispora CBS 962.96]